MVKRIVIFVLCIIFSATVFVSAQSADGSREQAVSGQGNMTPPQGGGGRMGRGPGGMGGGRGVMQPPDMENSDRPQPPGMTSEDAASDETAPVKGEESGGMQPSGMENSDRAQPPAMPPDNTSESVQDTSSAAGEDGSTEPTDMSGEGENIQPPEMQGGRVMGGFPENMQGEALDTEKNQQGAGSSVVGFLKEYSTPVTSIVLLILAFVFVKFYKRKTY